MKQRLIIIIVALDVLAFALLTLGNCKRNRLLNLAERVHLALCSYVRFPRSFSGFKSTKVVTGTVKRNSCLPHTVVPLGNTEVSMRVPGMSLAYVLPIFTARRFAQIAKSVVARVTVNMVYVAIRVISIGEKPCQAVRLMNLSISQANSDVSKRVSVASGLTNKSFFSCDQAGEYACILVVLQESIKEFWVNIVSSHAVSPVKKWFGQKPQSVSALLGLRHYKAWLLENKQSLWNGP